MSMEVKVDSFVDHLQKIGMLVSNEGEKQIRNYFEHVEHAVDDKDLFCSSFIGYIKTMKEDDLKSK